ncbi:GLPGLI family protein [Tenacibaculum haliotis]|uniref:GLPGLI family protein n=1 Tax=Tenacibaculum haliotis TaxID=1888914 RepID=UPI0021AF9D9D|nr:GLPGLI family protein [Tenacibaculum haliotis]MCT4700212.1 GLPGLI family protein [Tenacibaculum haliotis]
MNFKTLQLFLILCLLNITVFSQTKKQYAKAKVSYGIKMFIDKNLKKHKVLLQSFPEMAQKIETIASEFDFSLVFNDSISIFYLEKKIFSDNSAASLAIIHSGYFGRIKQLPNNYITENLQEDFGKFLVSRPYKKWKLHDETKQIGEYLCFKATTFHTTTNSKGKVFKRSFTAWYTPQLPYKFGPVGYGNLPGLIIELQGERATYGVKKIEFYNDNTKKNQMPRLKKKKLITEKKFEELAAKDEKRWLERNK